MKYTLILPSGKVMCFFVESVAKLYQTIYSGIIMTDEILIEKEKEVCQ
jgi:hypothetical protein